MPEPPARTSFWRWLEPFAGHFGARFPFYFFVLWCVSFASSSTSCACLRSHRRHGTANENGTIGGKLACSERVCLRARWVGVAVVRIDCTNRMTNKKTPAPV